jgi:hypothetical protein
MKINTFLQNGVVYISTTLKGKRIRYCTGIHLTDEVWNDGKLKPVTQVERGLVAKVSHIRDQALIQACKEDVTIANFLAELAILCGKSQRASKTLVGFAEEWLENYSKFHPESTTKSFKALISHLKLHPIDIAEVDFDYFLRLKEYFIEGQYSKNFMAKMISNFRRILHEAEDAGLWSGNTTKMKGGYEDVNNIYLTMQEVTKIHQLDLEPEFKNVADQFVIGCLTGLRYQDFSRVTGDYVNEFVIMDTLKTKARVTIPVHPFIREILTRNHWPVSNQNMNDKLKIIGRNAGITETVHRTRTQGNKSVTTKFEKCDLIFTHTARRTMATNMFLAGIPSTIIMKITGHKSERQFMSYIKITGEDVARILKEHPFFTGDGH